MRITMLALVAALLVTASPAFAGGGAKGDWELGVYGGYGWLDDYGIFHPKDNFLYGARLGYFVSRHWSLETSAQRLGTDTEFEIVGLEDRDVTLDAIRLNGLYNFRADEEFRPFLTAGIGYETIDVDGFGQSCDVGWNAGAGFRWFFSKHWNLRADGRYVSTNVGDEVDETQSNIEATLGLGLAFGGGGGTEAVEAVERPAENQPPIVSCAAERADILSGETVVIRATASDPDGDPLTYEWSTTVGRVTGTGGNATFDFTGATAPSAATVTVRVSDDHGHVASCETAVSLREAVRAAEAISCLAGGFPRNLSRLNNVDKACLDDVAQRLKADPRGRVIVIGHADSHESNPQRVAEQRAAAVRDYLVREAGIEASRVTTRSVAATKPLETGTDAGAQATNRRVQVWFVPEGATPPPD